MIRFVAPLDHDIVPVQPVTVSIAVSPEQTEVLLLFKVKIGEGVTFIVTADELSLTQVFKVQATL